jgi:hypothetical protein
MPEIFESRAVLELPPPDREPVSAAQPAVPGENLFSREVLGRVISRLDWPHGDDAEAEASLARLRHLAKWEGANPVTLRVRHADPTEARDIAWAIIAAYGEVRTEGQRVGVQQNIRDMTARVVEQERALAAAREKLEAVARRLTPEQIAGNPEAYAPPKAPMNEEELHQAARKLAARDPRLNPVVLREVPEVSRDPVSPVWWLNLGLGALAGLALSPLAAWLAGRRRDAGRDGASRPSALS